MAAKGYRAAVGRLSGALKDLLPPEAERQTRAFGDRLNAAGAPKKIVDQLVRLAELDGAIGVAALSQRTGVDVLVTTQAFTALGESLGLDWAQGTAMQLSPRDPWERLLAAGLSRDFQAMRLDFLARNGGKKPVEAVAKWEAANVLRVSGFRHMIDRARMTAAPSTAMLAQLAGQARVLLNRA
jgi:glutamate dehydrogenase